MVCKCCGVDKPKSEFYTDKHSKSGVRSKCKSCTVQEAQKRYWEKRDEIREYHKRHYLGYKDRQRAQDAEYFAKVYSLKTPCMKCGEDRLYIVDFHHIDPKQKSFNIYRKSSKSDFSVIENEAKKCVCLCRNCHGEFHHLYGQQPQFPIEALSEYLGREVKSNG